MRRLFIIRKDLNLSHGKLAAMVGHCCEAYWTNKLKKSISPWKKENELGQQLCYTCNLELPIDIVDEYMFGIFTKTICEAKNLSQLRKVDECIAEVNNILSKDSQLALGVDYGWINDKCLTELTPENDDGTTTVGIWFRPLPDDIAHKISKKYKLYGAFDKKTKALEYYDVVESSYGGMYDQSSESIGKYSSYDEAKKHFDYYVENCIKTNDVLGKNITLLEKDRCEYNDGNDWSYSLSICKKTVDGIKERFVVE